MSIDVHPPEVAIVGGGPAGAAAAITLARKGRQVLLLERSRFPRFHIGESLLPESNAPLEHLGLADSLRNQGFVVKRGASFMTEEGHRESHVDFSDSPEVEAPETYQVSRARFDELLLWHAQASGAHVIEGASVDEFQVGPAGVRITVSRGSETTTHEAQVLIDASGQAGLAARKLGIRRVDPKLRNVAVHAWFTGIPRPGGARAGNIRIVSLRNLSWVWLIPLDDDVSSVGLVMPRALARPVGRNLERHLRTIPALDPLLSGASRVTEVRRDADFSYYPTAYAGDRWLLVGDAGSFLDPVFSSGVLLALESGIEAGEAVDCGLGRGRVDGSAFAAFDRRQRRRYRFFRRFASGFYEPAFRDLFFAENDRWRLRPAIVSALAGVWKPSPATRLRLLMFFMCVAMQRRFALVPRLHATAAGAQPEGPHSSDITD